MKKALEKLLLVEMPKNDKNITRNDKYMTILKGAFFSKIVLFFHDFTLFLLFFLAKLVYKA